MNLSTPLAHSALHRLVRSGSVLLFFLAPTLLPAAEPDKDSKVDPTAFEVRFTDDSLLKLKLLHERLTLNTPYGKLQIPVAEIQRIEFAMHLPDDVAKRIDTAIVNLSSQQLPTREEASAELEKLKEKAYPALLAASKDKDPEVARRAEALLAKLRETVAEEKLQVRKFDVVQTEHSKISGHVETTTLKATTTQFGEVSLRVSEVRSLRSLSVAAETEVANINLDPGTLTAYQLQIGKTFTFRVTGNVLGGVWGSDAYTTDSALATAAVHAGVLQKGQTGNLKVKIIPSPVGFQGTTQNGVTSGAWGALNSAFQFVK